MTFESVEIPAERLPPVANDQASSSKTAAAVLIFVGALLCFAMVGALFDGELKPDKELTDSAEAAGDVVGFVIGIFLITGLPAVFGFRAARNASRATRAGKLAATDPSYTWRLSGKFIFAADAAGVPRPELSFKINKKLRAMLMAIPRASVVG
jgi:hypothetical protein